MENQTDNTLEFVLETMERLAQDQIVTWLSGGWAEELRGMCTPRSHYDVDLLYPAPNFARLDQWLTKTADISVLAAKQFSHKRAFFNKQVMIEVVLLEPNQKGGFLTNFFDQRYQLIWPPQSLGFFTIRHESVPVVSSEALHLYRQHHYDISHAYHAYCKDVLS